MKLIVDIPEELYDEYVSVNLGRGNGKNIVYNLLDAIKKGTSLKEWLKTFNTDSAPICFNKIQELKRECEMDERTTKS